MPPPPPGVVGGYPVPGPQNGMGIASLVLGIVGLLGCCTLVPSILALVFGIIGRKKVAQGVATNGGMATAGMILGIVGIVAGIVYWIYSVFNAASSGTFNT